MGSSPEKQGEPLPSPRQDRQAAARPEDLEWLSTLSESELDLLVSLKELAIQRAKNAGQGDMSTVFDLRMLRALGFIAVEYLKERIRTTSAFPNSAEMLKLLNRSGLASVDHKHEGLTTCNGDMKTLSAATPQRKRMWDGLCDEQASRCKKQKTLILDS